MRLYMGKLPPLPFLQAEAINCSILSFTVKGPGFKIPSSYWGRELHCVWVEGEIVNLNTSKFYADSICFVKKADTGCSWYAGGFFRQMVAVM